MEDLFSTHKLFLILIASFGCVAATILMKPTAQNGSAIIFMIIAAILGFTALSQLVAYAFLIAVQFN